MVWGQEPDERCLLDSGGSTQRFFVSEDLPVGSVLGKISVKGELEMKTEPSPGEISISATKKLTVATETKPVLEREISLRSTDFLLQSFSSVFLTNQTQNITYEETICQNDYRYRGRGYLHNPPQPRGGLEGGLCCEGGDGERDGVPGAEEAAG